jgi:hypothetical protein
MKKINSNKKYYCQPTLIVIKLDIQISLALESDNNPGSEPGDWVMVPDNFKNDPYKNTMG